MNKNFRRSDQWRCKKTFLLQEDDSCEPNLDCRNSVVAEYFAQVLTNAVATAEFYRRIFTKPILCY